MAAVRNSDTASGVHRSEPGSDAGGPPLDTTAATNDPTSPATIRTTMASCTPARRKKDGRASGSASPQMHPMPYRLRASGPFGAFHPPLPAFTPPSPGRRPAPADPPRRPGGRAGLRPPPPPAAFHVVPAAGLRVLQRLPRLVDGLHLRLGLAPHGLRRPAMTVGVEELCLP